MHKARAELVLRHRASDANDGSEGDAGGEQKKADISIYWRNQTASALTWDVFRTACDRGKGTRTSAIRAVARVKELEIEVRRRFNHCEESQGMMASRFHLFQQSIEFLNAAALLERQLTEELHRRNYHCQPGSPGE